MTIFVTSAIPKALLEVQIVEPILILGLGSLRLHRPRRPILIDVPALGLCVGLFLSCCASTPTRRAVQSTEFRRVICPIGLKPCLTRSPGSLAPVIRPAVPAIVAICAEIPSSTAGLACSSGATASLSLFCLLDDHAESHVLLAVQCFHRRPPRRRIGHGHEPEALRLPRFSVCDDPSKFNLPVLGKQLFEVIVCHIAIELRYK